MDDEFAAVVEDQGDQFDEASCWVGAEHHPAPGAVFIIEGTRVQHMGSGVEDSRIIEAVTSVVLTRGLVQLRQRGPRSGLRPGSPLSGW